MTSEKYFYIYNLFRNFFVSWSFQLFNNLFKAYFLARQKNLHHFPDNYNSLRNGF